MSDTTELRLEAQRWIDKHPPDTNAEWEEGGDLIYRMMIVLKHQEADIEGADEKRAAQLLRTGELLAAIIDHKVAIQASCDDLDTAPTLADKALWALMEGPPLVSDERPDNPRVTSEPDEPSADTTLARAINLLVVATDQNRGELTEIRQLLARMNNDYHLALTSSQDRPG